MTAGSDDAGPTEFVPASNIPRAAAHPFSETAPTSRRQGETAPPKDGANDSSVTADDEGKGNGEATADATSTAAGNTATPTESTKNSRADKPSAFRDGVLSTACPPLDALLDGGIETDAITLVFGEAGSGKTNLALQLAREAARAGHRVAYVDTEGVSATRLAQVFGADAQNDEAARAAQDAQDRLLFFTPFDIQQQERMVKNATLAPDLGLVVVDSINMHYRLHIDGGDDLQREANRSLVQQLHHLTTFARKQHVPVLVTGQVYGGEDSTQPFARRTMEHLVKALVRFHKTPDGGRKATILKHRSIPDGEQARFRIAQDGLVALKGE